MCLPSYLYVYHHLAWYFVIPMMGILVSFIHDLIHELYFKSRPWVQHFMFAVIWASKRKTTTN